MTRSNEILVILCFCFYVGAAEELSAGSSVCVTAQKKFAEHNVEFERCTMMNAVADNFCVKCIVLYVEQFQAYDELQNARGKSAKNDDKLCGQEVAEEDHFDILRTHFTRTKSLWNTARCTKCFSCDPENIPKNGNITALCTIEANSSDLQDAAAIAQDCITNSPQNVCKDCAYRFDLMMAKYKVQDSVGGGEFCFDVKDAIDRTRQMWQKAQCDSRISSEWSFTPLFLLCLAVGAISYGSFRSYKVYRLRREYLTTAIVNSDNSNNYRMLEEQSNDSEL